MHKQIHSRLTAGLLLVLLLLTLGAGGLVSAQETLPVPNAPDGSQASAYRLTPDLSGLEINQSFFDKTVRYPDGRVQVIVTLGGEPAVRAYLTAGGRTRDVSARAAAIARVPSLRAEQADFASRAAGLNTTVLNASWYLVNTVTLAVPQQNVGALLSLPGVVAITPDWVVERDDTTSVPLTGAPVAWTPGTYSANGFTGRNQVIAVVDTGIDYTHTMFGGPGNFSVVPDDTTLTGVPAGLFPAAGWDPVTGFATAGAPKVVGGWDFVGNTYNAASSNPANLIPQPDPNPLDCAYALGGGHGSHVAGTAAGWGVTAAGATYTGPFDNTIYPSYPAPTLTNFKAGPGTAPRAALIALRVFGCQGSTATSNTIAAMEAAASGQVVDGSGNVLASFPQATVMNLSLGSGFGDADPLDPQVVAVTNAIAAGTMYVGSAGNSANVHFISGSPSAAPAGLSIANSVDSSALLRGGATRTTGAGAPFFYPGEVAAFGPPEFPDFVGTAVISDPVNGCTAISAGVAAPLANAAAVAGKIVVIARGGCEFGVKASAAYASGAVGLIVTNSDGSAPIGMGGGTSAPPPAAYNLPSVMISLANGDDLRAAIALGETSVAINSTNLTSVSETTDTLSTSSSRGPSRNNENSFKPDMAAPGTTIMSAMSGSGSNVVSLSGTSMASPHMAGIFAVMMEAYPTWSLQQIKALLMNTANNDIVAAAGPIYHPPQRAGSGRVDVVDAFDTQVIAYNTANPEGVNVSFGFLEVTAPTTFEKNITLQNLSATDKTFNTGVLQRTDIVGASVSFSVSPASVLVPANSTVNVTVTLNANPFVDGINTKSDPTYALSSTTNQNYLYEESAIVTFTPVDTGSVLRVPVYASVRPGSALASAAPETVKTMIGSTNLTITGQGMLVGTGTGAGVQSVTTTFELVASDGPEAIPALYQNADLEYVGINSDYLTTTNPNGGYTYFGFATYREWNTLAEVSFNVYLDFDQDGNPEFVAFNGISSLSSDIYTSSFADLNNCLGFGAGAIRGLGDIPNMLKTNNINTYRMNNNVVMLPVATEALNTCVPTDTSPAFNYWIDTDSFRFPTTVDAIGSAAAPLTYNPLQAAYTFGGFGLPTGNGTSIPVTINHTDLADAPDILLLHHHNADAATRAEVVDMQRDAGIDFVFNLLSPANGAQLLTRSAIEAFNLVTWEANISAATFTFELTLPSGAKTTLANLSPAADPDPLTCDSTTCSLTVADSYALLTEDGEYSWEVFAVNPFGQIVSANGPFTFTADDQPQPFALVSPANNALVISPAALGTITWGDADAINYQFSLIKASTNKSAAGGIGVVVNAVLTSDADADGLTCDGTLCTFNPDLSALTVTDGTYLWTVIAINGDNQLEAFNGAYLFRLNSTGVELVVNGGFEVYDPTVMRPTGWVWRSAPSGRWFNRPSQANTGIGSMRLVASPTPPVIFAQNLANKPNFLAHGGIFAGEQVQVSAFYRTATPTAGSMRLWLRYADGTRQFFTIPLTGGTGYQYVEETFTMPKDVVGARIEFRYVAGTGNIQLDDVSALLLPPATPAPLTAPDVDGATIDLPQAPDAAQP